MNEFERDCPSRELKINVGKSVALKVKKNQRGSCEKVKVTG